jgi:multimeric flavodoxin WrbA
MGKVKILGIVGSPRHHSNTEVMVREALKGAEETGSVETEMLLLAGKKIISCIGCLKCLEKQDLCVFRFKDDMQEFYEKYMGADGLIIGSPVYHASISGILKNVIDRLGQGLGGKYGEFNFPWLCKVGGVLAQGLGKFGGQEFTMQFLVNHLLLLNNIVVSADAPQIAIGVGGTFQDKPGWEAGIIGERDPEALEASKLLGKRVGEITKIVKAGVRALQNELPDDYKKNVLGKPTLK